jgi:hypothetical protein
MDQERNEFLEMDGLYWESETHEWFHDKIGTNYAQTDDGLHKDSLKNIFCFILRNKETGGYNRVVMDSDVNEVIYDTESVEEAGVFIDRLKVSKRFS